VQTAFTIAVISSVVLTLLGLAVAPALAAFFGVPEDTSLFRLAALNILLVGLGNVQDGILLRDLAFGRRFVADALRATLRAAVAIGLALAGYGAASLVWGMLAGTAVWVVVLFAMTRLRPTMRIDRGAVRSMASYAAKSAALASLAAVTTRVDVIVIGRLLGERALGLYTVAFRVPELAIQAVAWQLSLVMFPALSRKRATDEAGLPAATVRLIRLQALYVLPVAAGLSVLAVPLVGVLFGPAWRDATEVLVPVTVLSAMQGVTFPLGDVLKATGRQGVLLALNVISIPLLVVTMSAVASRGLAAVSWARVATTALFSVLLVVAAWRLAAVSPRGVVRALGPGCVAALGAFAGAGGVRLLWDDVSFLALGAAACAGAAGAAALVVLCAPAAVEELLRVVPALAALKRRLTAPPVAAGRGEGSS
jgi:PST family polysaccharide transporter